MSTQSKTQQAAARAEALEYLTETLNSATRYVNRRGDVQIKVYATVAHVAPSGMSRVLKMFVVDREDGDLITISWKIAQINGYRWSDAHGGFLIQGCGMDMGFAALNELSRHLPSELGVGSGNDFDLRYI